MMAQRRRVSATEHRQQPSRFSPIAALLILANSFLDRLP
jgi:hypothetical protein